MEQGIRLRVERVLDLPGVTHSNALSLRLGVWASSFEFQFLLPITNKYCLYKSKEMRRVLKQYRKSCNESMRNVLLNEWKGCVFPKTTRDKILLFNNTHRTKNHLHDVCCFKWRNTRKAFRNSPGYLPLLDANLRIPKLKMQRPRTIPESLLLKPFYVQSVL